MNKFKVGDRVVVYGVYGRLKGEICRDKPDSTGRITFRTDDGYVNEAYPQQCRRLVTKPRRRVWIPESNLKNLKEDSLGTCRAEISDEKLIRSDIEFIEVVKNKK